LRLDPRGFDTVGTPGPKHQFANYTVPVGGTRSDNTLGFRSPDWGGFKTNFAWSTGEGARSNSVGGDVEYTAGPLYMAAAKG
jgi:predicted porin